MKLVRIRREKLVVYWEVEYHTNIYFIVIFSVEHTILTDYIIYKVKVLNYKKIGKNPHSSNS
jgi:hypothetical protein